MLTEGFRSLARRDASDYRAIFGGAATQTAAKKTGAGEQAHVGEGIAAALGGLQS